MKMNMKDEQKEIVNFFKILVILLVLIAIVYVASRAFISKDLFKKDDGTSSEVSSIEFDYGTTIIGEMFNRPYNEYYVILFDSTASDASYFGNMVYAYKGDTKLYSVDLNDTFNRPYVSKESNPKAEYLTDLKINGTTLVKIKKGKIVKYIEDKDGIVDELKK